MAKQIRDLHILLIEDNDGDAELLRAYLEDLPGKRFHVHHVKTLAEAGARLPDDSVDLIVLDLDLPDSSGLHTIEHIHEVAPRTPVVVLSGVADEELGQRAIQVGAQDFLHKNSLGPYTLARSLRYATERGRLQAQLRAIVANNPDAILVVDHEGSITFVNKAAEALFGRERGSMTGERFGYPIDGQGMSEISLERSGKDTRAAEMHVAPIEWEGASAWLATIRDVTDRKRAEELQQRLYHADRLASIGQLASGVAHEINNPTCFIQGNLSVLQEHLCAVESAVRRHQMAGLGLPETADLAYEFDPEEPSYAKRRHVRATTVDGEDDLESVIREMHKMLSENLAGVDRIARIVKGLSTFSRVERDVVEEVDVNEVVQVACNMTENEIRHRALLQQTRGRVPKILADRSKLVQVLTNLMINAAHAIEPGAAERNRIEVSTWAGDESVHIAVEDTGCGIPAELLDRIFTPFFTTKERGTGTGLGLALSSDIIKHHQGELRVQSTVGKGTRFEIVLPRETGMRASDQTAESPPRPRPSARARVLIVDDEPLLLRTFNRMLRRNHEVLLAEGGLEAITILSDQPDFDVIICDLMMPGMDGIRFHQTVGERWPALQARILYCSGGAFTREAKEFVNSLDHKDRVIEKPVRKASLLERIEWLLNHLNG